MEFLGEKLHLATHPQLKRHDSEKQKNLFNVGK